MIEVRKSLMSKTLYVSKKKIWKHSSNLLINSLIKSLVTDQRFFLHVCIYIYI